MTIKQILAFLAVLFLAFPVFAQSAREDLKKDPSVIAANLSDAELDKLVDAVKAQAERDEKVAAHNKVTERMEKMLQANPGLKNRLVRE